MLNQAVRMVTTGLYGLDAVEGISEEEKGKS
jgi:hypothetical protein